MHAGGTLKIVGLEDMGPEVLLKRVSKETLLGDIQYRGAISDFTIVKKQISKADYDELLIRYNEEDVYGDGNNFELAVTKAAAEAFETQEAERVVAAAAAAEAAAEAEATKPGRRKEPSPFPSRGSARARDGDLGGERGDELGVAEADDAGIPQALELGFRAGAPDDADAITLWNSGPWSVTRSRKRRPCASRRRTSRRRRYPRRAPAAQATPLAPKPMSTQYEPRSSSAGFESAGGGGSRAARETSASPRTRPACARSSRRWTC